MIEDADDKRKVAELSALRQELVHAPTAGEAEMVAAELLRKTLAHGSDNPDPICARIESELIANPMQYSSLLSVWDGNTRGASAMVRDHMIELGRLGKSWSMRRSIAHLDSLAFRIVNR